MQKIKVYELDGSLNEISEIFYDLNYFGNVHPLIQHVERINSRKEEENYKIYEKPFRWLPISITYNAQVISKKDNKIKYVISGIPFTKAQISYDLSQETNQKTKIKWDVQIESKIFIEKILIRKMMKAQDDIVCSIQAEMKNDKI